MGKKEIKLFIFSLIGIYSGYCGPTPIDVTGIPFSEIKFGENHFCLLYYDTRESSLFLECKELGREEWKKFLIEKSEKGNHLPDIVFLTPSWYLGSKFFALSYNRKENLFVIGYGTNLLYFDPVTGGIKKRFSFPQLAPEEGEAFGPDVHLIYTSDLPVIYTDPPSPSSFFLLYKEKIYTLPQIPNYTQVESEALRFPYPMDDRYIIFPGPNTYFYIDSEEFEKGFQEFPAPSPSYYTWKSNFNIAAEWDHRFIFCKVDSEKPSWVESYTFSVPPFIYYPEFKCLTTWDGCRDIDFIFPYKDDFYVVICKGEFYETGGETGWEEVWVVEGSKIKNNCDLLREPRNGGTLIFKADDTYSTEHRYGASYDGKWFGMRFEEECRRRDEAIYNLKIILYSVEEKTSEVKTFFHKGCGGCEMSRCDNSLNLSFPFVLLLVLIFTKVFYLRGSKALDV